MPKALVGTWDRTMTGAAWKKNHVTGEPAGVYSVVISSDGTATLEFDATPFTHMPAAASGTVLKLGATADEVCARPATYAWSVSGRTLTLHLKKDDCDPRRGLFSGPLKRK